jgi:hypothetical protein
LLHYGVLIRVHGLDQSLGLRLGISVDREHMFHDHVDHQLSNSGDDTVNDVLSMGRAEEKKIESSVGFEAGDT